MCHTSLLRPSLFLGIFLSCSPKINRIHTPIRGSQSPDDRMLTSSSTVAGMVFDSDEGESVMNSVGLVGT